jgi:hypothetical protein
VPVIINSSSSGELNPGLDGSGGPVATAIATVRTTGLTVTCGGNVVDALSAQVTYDWALVAGEAHVVLPALQGCDIDQGITIVINGETCFQGTVRQIDSTLAPHSVSLLCKTSLYLLEEWENGTETIEADEGKPGLAFSDLVGAETATLREIVTAVLDRVGISYSLGNLDNPSHVYGTDAPEELTWGTHESASAYLHRIFEASAGYRLFDSSDGNLYLTQISAIPSTTADYTFTLGDDIFGDSSSSFSAIGQKSAVLVEGYDDGAGAATSGIVGSGISTFRVTSPLIEDDAFCTELASFWLPQLDRRQQTVRLSTPRQELFGLAQSHYIDATGGLSVSQRMWVKAVVREIAASHEFTQHLTYVAGAAA